MQRYAHFQKRRFGLVVPWEPLLVPLTLLALFASALFAVGQEPVREKPVRVGMAKAFFLDYPKIFVKLALADFRSVITLTSGLKADIDTSDDADVVADRLNKRELDLGIFHGHEFAWLRKHHPELRPLVIIPGKHEIERAYVVVHRDSAAHSIADLKGKRLNKPFGMKEHCRLFLERTLADTAKMPVKRFFSGFDKSASQTAALDAVGRGDAEATIVDMEGWEFYKEIKGPAQTKNLRVLAESDPFPPAVIAYREGALDEGTLTRFRDGLFKAPSTREGRELMKAWNIAAFRDVPADHARSMDAVLKCFPPPDTASR